MSDPNPFPPIPEVKGPLSEEDFIMLESLVKSPVFGALKRVILMYRQEAQSVLETSSDTHKMFQAQGRIAGVKAIENVALLVKSWRTSQEVKAKAEDAKEKRDNRLRSQDKRLPIR